MNQILDADGVGCKETPSAALSVEINTVVEGYAIDVATGDTVGKGIEPRNAAIRVEIAQL